MLRLTLRTLLAYLDDTLEPSQAKDIGKKVAESDYAQELVERIKTVTRRRRLAAPPLVAEDSSTDPNTIAEYLDNALSPEQVSELEKSALDNDVRLAEVSSCHQILTLVLGEPARVPPTARRRMYRLVTGPESLPYRKQTAAGAPVAGLVAPTEIDDFVDHEDDPLTSFLGTRKVLWLIWIFVAIGLLVLAVLLAVPAPPAQPNQGYVGVPGRTEQPPRSATTTSKGPATVVPETNVGPPVPLPPVISPEVGPLPREIGVGPPPPRQPDSERRVLAAADTPMQPLLYRKRDTIAWERVDANEARVSTTDTLLALPGFHPELRLDSGVRLQLWGSVAEFLPLPLSESRIELFVPANGVDADLMLHGGRVFITAPKLTRPMHVRVRMRNEVWDITLNTPDTEVAIDLIGEPAKGPLFNRDLLESPRSLAYLGVLQGGASLRSGFQQSGDLPVGSKWKWDSKGGRPGPAPKDDPDELGMANRWTRAVPATPAGKEMAAAVAEMARRTSVANGPFDIDLDATLKDPRETAGRRVLCTWMLGSVDSLAYLIDALEQDSATIRDAAARAIRHWVVQDPQREEAFAQALMTKAAYSENQRALVIALLHGTERPPGDAINDVFDLLSNDKLAIRELARMQLAKLDPVGAREANYDAGSDRRAMQAVMWKTSFKKRFRG
jgi:hypothetical protein